VRSATRDGLGPEFVRVTAANFCFFMTFASFFLLPLHVRELGGAESTIGLVMGTAGVAGLVSLVGVGWALDRLGRRVVLLGGFVAMAGASAAFATVGRIGPALYALRVVQGFAFAAGFNAASTLAVEFAPPDGRAGALGLFGVSTLTTHALAPALGEVIARHAGFPTLFLLAAACSLVAIAIAWPLPEGRGLRHAERVPFRPSTVLVVTFVTVACCGVGFGTVITYVPTFVRDTGLGAVGTFFLSYTTAAVLTRVFAGGVGDAVGRRPVIVPALVLLAASTAALASVRSASMLAGTALLFGTAQGLLYPTLNAFAIDQVDVAHLGRAQTAYNGAFNLGTTLGSVALGPVVEAVGYPGTFRLASVVALVALAVFGVGTVGAGAAAQPAAGSSARL